MEHAHMEDQHDPQALLDAAFAGELSLDGEQTAAEAPGETGESTNQDDGVQAAETADDKPAESDASTDAEPEGAPIASKSGTYTIPYEKLAEARTKAASLATENETLKAQLAELTAKQQQNLAAAQDQAQARADAGKAPTETDQNLQAAQDAIDQGVDPAIFGDFSEEGIAKGISTLMGQVTQQVRAELKAELEQSLAPVKATAAKSAQEAHFGAIYAKHADADELMESGEFQQWRQTLPAFARAGVENALTKGTANDVIEVFDSFKQATGKIKTPQPSPEVKDRIPASLSEIVGAPPVDQAQRVLNMANNPAAILDAMSTMTPEQIDALMNRV